MKKFKMFATTKKSIFGSRFSYLQNKDKLLWKNILSNLRDGEVVRIIIEKID